MQCSPSLVLALSSLLGALGFLLLCLNLRAPARYGKHQEKPGKPWTRVPARGAWFLQELPSFLVPALLLALRSQPRLEPLGCRLLCGMFCGHYFHRTFIYSFFTRGRPFPLQILLFGTLFCIYNGFLQGYYMIYCAQYPKDWFTDFRFTSGVLLFLIGMGINIHSDILLRQLRKPGDHTYKIPQGGLFTYVSGANFFGEIVEWFGYAIATWSIPAFAFALFTLCFIGPRAYHHHRYQNQDCFMLTYTCIIQGWGWNSG
ncbi:3-oxo-5-alpha-steroid 4-dehydrogenase 2 isoform X2 [Malaclemys terrapin pileata]|uniref:3-oxo-5-alpha-steroid 4-dehydrogenase 2 isoform X2 n=1 Tax=Malaclemys terrapin pileata TaxID=2991368 RepID=UPI0023A896FD|nr:3-oxo-5-alpha-steroid 4-dehydrogenase 2 isoform X2 [Malaclemys terrapin pileata]